MVYVAINKSGRLRFSLTKATPPPGVAAPVRMISENPEAVYDYTSKGNLVAVISNGSAILGMGNLGALASKPVMEGKAVLFKRFADIDSIDLEIDCSDADEIVNSIKNFAPSFGGINLEDIAAPDCFIIEQKLKEILDIPVFHDDQHGTAIITTAALINALDISGKSISGVKVVVNGAGASAQACTELFKNSGVPSENIIMVDRKGVIFKGFSRKKYLANSSKKTNLKVGVCSEFLIKSHTIGKLFTKVLLDLLKTDIELIIYIPPNRIRDSEQDLVENTFKRVIYLPYSTDKASKLIFSDNLDILFYPDIGMSNYTYILALSRLALVQATSLGHPNTTGIKNIDYFISNDIVPHHPSSSYTERLIKFSRLPFNYPTPKINESKLTSKNLIPSNNNFIIGLTQSLFKLHPDFDQILESILEEIKNAYLILVEDQHGHTAKNLKDRWKKRSNSLLERSIFLKRMSNEDFLNTTKNCHIMLDPFYFGSGNTFYEAMAFGIPFVTYPFSQRGSLVASGYKQMGIKNPPIAKSPKDYINWCKKYANNSLFLQKTKDELKDKAQKYLFNDNEIYKEYYTFFTEAVHEARQGKLLEEDWMPLA